MQRTLPLGLGAFAALLAVQPALAQSRPAKPVARMAQLPAGSQRTTREVLL